MAEWVANQIIVPDERIRFEEYNPGDPLPNFQWSSNLLDLIGGGFVKSLEIYGTPGAKIYVGPILEDEELENIKNCLILGPNGVFKLQADDGFLLSNVRIAKESYDFIVENSGYLAFNIISSYAPSSATTHVIIYNGGGVVNE